MSSSRRNWTAIGVGLELIATFLLTIEPAAAGGVFLIGLLFIFYGLYPNLFGFWPGASHHELNQKTEPPSRNLSTDQRNELIKMLSALYIPCVNVKITVFPSIYVPFAQSLDAVFKSSNWDTNTNITPQEPFHHRYFGGIDVRGFNKHLIDGVVEALREVGIRDAKPDVMKLKILKDNPKFSSSNNNIYIRIGHIDNDIR